MNRTKAIGDGATGIVMVWSGYAREIGTNGEGGDRCCTLMIGPAVKTGDEYLWIDTNGDPLMIGWLEDGEVVYNEAEFVGVGGRIVDLERDDQRWIADLIASEVF